MRTLCICHRRNIIPSHGRNITSICRRHIIQKIPSPFFKVPFLRDSVLQKSQNVNKDPSHDQTNIWIYFWFYICKTQKNQQVDIRKCCLQLGGKVKLKLTLMLSLSKNDYSWENESFLSSVIPQLSSQIDWTTHSDLRTKIRWKCNLKTKNTHAACAISPSRWQKTSKHTCFSMMERSPTVAISVAIQASVKDTCWFTVERNLMLAHSATTPVQKLGTSGGTFIHIQE